MTLALPVLQAKALKPYPQTPPADQNVILNLFDLWHAKRRFVILSGPPGVGKTRAAEDLVEQILVQEQAHHDKQACRITNLFPDFRTKTYTNTEIEAKLSAQQISFVWDMCVLHPQYAYEDLIRGYKADNTANGSLQLSVREGLLGFAARVVLVLQERSPSADLPRGILILDEINRAPIGQLFGEALYALDRPGSPVTTPYELEHQGSSITIPEALMLLGTMNSVDRAVSGFDFALRRRFAVIAMKSSAEPIDKRLESLPIAKGIALELYKLLVNFVAASTQRGVVPLSELTIGHSYFLPPLSVSTEEDALRWLATSYQYQILPTLVDYHEQGLVAFKRDLISSLPFGATAFGEISLGEVDADQIRNQLSTLSPASSTTTVAAAP